MQRYFKLRPSRTFAVLLFLLCAASLVPLWLMPVMRPAVIALTVVILYGVGHCLTLDASLRREHSCVAFRLEDSEEIVLVLRNGKHLSGRLSPDCLVTPHFVILNVVLSDQHGKRSLRIFPDAMSVDSFRRLRVALRWGISAGQLTA